MSIEALEGLTDEQLFSDANADEEVTEQVVTEPAPEPEVQPEQALAEPTEPVATDPPTRAPVDDNAPQVPSWRVREINDEKRQIAAENERMKAELAQLRQAPPQPAPQKEEDDGPDPLLDPKAYKAAIREELRQEILSERRETSLANAHKTHKGEFEEAYAAAQKQVDPALKARMQQSRDPGETLMEWHREQKTRAEVGTDPNAYFNKRFEAYLADPANQAKVLERIRGGVQQPQPGAPRQAAPVDLPPSLTRATNASTITAADDDDISNDGLWRHANA